MDTKVGKKDKPGFYRWSGDLTQSAWAVQVNRPYPCNGEGLQNLRLAQTSDNIRVNSCSFVVSARSLCGENKVRSGEGAAVTRVKERPGFPTSAEPACSPTYPRYPCNPWLNFQGFAKPIWIGAPGSCVFAITALSGCTSMSLYVRSPSAVRRGNS